MRTYIVLMIMKERLTIMIAHPINRVKLQLKSRLNPKGTRNKKMTIQNEKN